MTAHRMAGEHERTFAPLGPVAPEGGEVGNPVAEIVDVAGDRVRAQPAGAGLPAPVERRDAPALSPPMLQGLEILFVGITAAGKEQQVSSRLAAGFRPVDTADRVPVRGRPAAFTGADRNSAAVECRRAHLIRLANSALLPVVTF